MTSPSVPVLAPKQAPEAGGYAKGDRETGETGLSGLTEPNPEPNSIFGEKKRFLRNRIGPF